jgi:hypothetical protein
MTVPSTSHDSIFTRAAPLSAEPPEGRTVARTVVATWWLLVGLFIVVSTIYGVVRNYTPIPYMDQWDGVIGFWRAVQSGDTSAWWAQHNEHRIVVPRLLFWADMRWFGGVNLVTITANVLLHIGVAAIFLLAYVRYGLRRHSLPGVAGVVLLASMAWMQDDNFNWGFQVQFTLVYLFAMLAFLAYARGVNRNGAGWQVVAFGSATLAMLSMANGVLVFPLLALAAVVSRSGMLRVAAAAMATVVAWTAYFHGYAQPAYHAGLADGLVHHPFGVVHYALAFLGSPAAFLGARMGTAAACGAVMVLASAWVVVQLLRPLALTAYRLFLVLVLGFTLLAAFSAALGRFDLGIATALSSRYTTPALIAWTALFLLYTDLYPPRAFWTVLGLLAVTVAPATVWSQRELAGDRSADYDRAVAVIGLRMGIEDPLYIDTLYPPGMRQKLRDLASYAQAQGLSMYTHSWVAQIGVLEYAPARVDPGLCRGAFDSTDTVTAGYRLRGWAVVNDRQRMPLILFVDDNNATVGYGIAGEYRPDVPASVPGATVNAGWRGYVVHSRGPVRAFVYTQDHFCPLAANTRLVAP